MILKRPCSVRIYNTMEEKKSTYKGNTEARRRANAKYLSETVEDIKIRVPKGAKEKYKQAAADAGKSLNQFAIDSMEYQMHNASGDPVRPSIAPDPSGNISINVSPEDKARYEDAAEYFGKHLDRFIVDTIEAKVLSIPQSLIKSQPLR